MRLKRTTQMSLYEPEPVDHPLGEVGVDLGLAGRASRTAGRGGGRPRRPVGAGPPRIELRVDSALRRDQAYAGRDLARSGPIQCLGAFRGLRAQSGAGRAVATRITRQKPRKPNNTVPEPPAGPNHAENDANRCRIKEKPPFPSPIPTNPKVSLNERSIRKRSLRTRTSLGRRQQYLKRVGVKGNSTLPPARVTRLWSDQRKFYRISRDLHGALNT